LISAFSAPGRPISSADSQQVLAGDVQVFLKQQVIVLVDAARQRILDGDQGRVAGSDTTA
jgi:hypothetical protein